ncbi:MAG TPA: PEP-CTERM sorting domain-containing protein, partial [Pirellulales bacterium]
YPNTTGLTTSSSSLVGLSSNTIASTAPLATGDAITFNFNSLPLTYGSDYSAVFVNVDGSGNITPVLVSALQVHYVNTGVDTGSGTFHPAINYGTESQFQYTTSNFINGGFFSAFGYAGDMNFTATLDTTAVPEPSALLLGIGGAGLLGLTQRKRIRTARIN